MAEPLATRVVRPCARQNDAVGVESFCCVQIGFEQKRSASQEKSSQKDAHGEICGLDVCASPCGLLSQTAGGESEVP